MRLASVLLTIVAALVASAPTVTAQTVRIGASVSMTGTYAKPGLHGRDGYRLCQKHVNEQGGFLGRPIELVLYDDRSDPQTGVRLYERLLSEDHVDGVMGPYSSAITEAAANVAEKYGK